MTLGVNYGLVDHHRRAGPVGERHTTTSACSSASTCRSTTARSTPPSREAQARAVADARLYEAERDGTFREIKDLFSQAQAQRATLDLFQGSILPRAREALDVATRDYQAGDVDFLTLITAWREVLQIELQVAQFESEPRQEPGLAGTGRRPPAQCPSPGRDAVPHSTTIPIPGRQRAVSSRWRGGGAEHDNTGVRIEDHIGVMVKNRNATPNASPRFTLA